ncbi:MAG TPA: hypothetical protein VE263_11840 [Candidatus Angelobacter sp.]|nr:hypothetical protein [Candidatus Angelobacter sp.]
MKYILLVLVAAIFVSVVFELSRALRTYFKFRGKRIITCPENHQAAAVSVAAGSAAVEAFLHAPHLNLSECSRWPEKAGCGQECLSQIKESPEACLVSHIVNRWYEGKSCAYCHKPFGEIHWHDHPPALVNEQRQTVLWNEVPLERLQQTMATHWPVCWDCHIAETFRRQHPEMVTDRPAH